MTTRRGLVGTVLAAVAALLAPKGARAKPTVIDLTPQPFPSRSGWLYGLDGDAEPFGYAPGGTSLTNRTTTYQPGVNALRFDADDLPPPGWVQALDDEMQAVSDYFETGVWDEGDASVDGWSDYAPASVPLAKLNEAREAISAGAALSFELMPSGSYVFDIYGQRHWRPFIDGRLG